MPHLPDSHHDHDLALVAALAAGDAQGRDHTRATELVTSCVECALVRDDLVVLASSLHALPAPRRTHDYRLTAEQAAALRPTGWRRLLGAFGGTGFRFATPVGTAMATLGIAGLLLSAVPSSLPAGTTGDGTNTAGGAPAAASEGAILETLVPSLGYGLAGGSAIPDVSASAAGYQPAASEITRANASAAAPSVAPSASTESLASIAASAPPASRAADLAQSTAATDTPVPTRTISSPTALVFTSLLLLVGGAMLVFLRAASRRVTPV
jgi:hypothetical protein